MYILAPLAVTSSLWALTLGSSSSSSSSSVPHGDDDRNALRARSFVPPPAAAAIPKFRSAPEPPSEPFIGGGGTGDVPRLGHPTGEESCYVPRIGHPKPPGKEPCEVPILGHPKQPAEEEDRPDGGDDDPTDVPAYPYPTGNATNLAAGTTSTASPSPTAPSTGDAARTMGPQWAALVGAIAVAVL